MKKYNFKDTPLEVYGVPFWKQTGQLRRLPDSVIDKVPRLKFLGKRCPGARVCFRTDAGEFTVRITFETLTVDVGMSIYACQSAAVLIGERENAHFAGLVNPPDYNTFTFEKTIHKEKEMEDVTIFLPRNEIIANVEIIVPKEAKVESPTPYRALKPILYYGSSITEGGCCCSVFNAYNAILSNRLNVDYSNFGFSGSAKGELEIADYINTIGMSLFVYDYDHNASTAKDLRKTHEPFFKRIREKNPNLPVIMLSKPAARYTENDKIRRHIILQTYINAINAGDANVYFVDGETLFGNKDREICTIDMKHPNDIGFLRMADTLEPLIRRILSV